MAFPFAYTLALDFDLLSTSPHFPSSVQAAVDSLPIRPFDLLQILGAGLEVVWVCLVAPLVATRNVARACRYVGLC